MSAPHPFTWWRHQMETFSALLAICVGNSPVSGEFPIQRPVTRSFDVFFDLRLYKRLRKQWWGYRAHCDVIVMRSATMDTPATNLQPYENSLHDVIKWKHFPRYWPFVRGIHLSPVNSPHKGQWRYALMFSFICAFNKRLGKHSWGWWFETPWRPLWRHCNEKSSASVVKHHHASDKMDAILHTTFPNAFSWMKVFEFRLRFHYEVCLLGSN